MHEKSFKKFLKKTTAELFFKSNCTLAEGPVWDDGVFYWTDIIEKTIFTKRDDATSVRKYELPFEVGSFVLWKRDHLVLATENGFYSLNLVTERIEEWEHPEKTLRNNRFNDGKCDLKGRFVAGTLNRLGKPEAALYVLDHDKTVRAIYSPVTCSNGLAWSKNGSVFYHVDTPTRVVRAFNYDLENGGVKNERVIIKIPKSHGKPDGMTIDRNGNLWIALWGGWGVECWSPNDGTQLARIEVPVALVTNCVFGGENCETLFITTARSSLDEKTLDEQPLAGSIFYARPGVRGFQCIHFGNA